MGCLDTWLQESVATWEERWGVPRLEVHDALSSTNDRVRALADSGAPAFSTVIALTQTAGRGRGGKEWESPSGLGLWMSFLLRPHSEENVGLTPLLVGLGTARAIEKLCPAVSPRIKWPNDIFLQDLKVCGILCEGVGQDGVVVGLGLNVHQRLDEFSPDLRGRATSLEAAGCLSVTLPPLAGEVLEQTRRLVEPLPGALAEDLLAEFARRDSLAGRRVRTATGLEGRAVGFADDGGLLVESEGVRHTIRGGGISLA